MTAPVVVLGGGPAGLGAAWWLTKSGRAVIVVEKEPRVGGMGASVPMKNCLADFGPHTFHLKKGAVTELFERLAGANAVRVRRDAKLWLHGKCLPFPLQPRDVATQLSPILVSRIAADYAWERTVGRVRRGPGWTPQTFEEWGTWQFGHTLYRLAFGTYSEKMWGQPGRLLSAKLARQKLLTISLKELVLAMLGLLGEEKADAMGLSSRNLYDAYPRKGIGSFYESMADEIRARGGEILLESTTEEVVIERDRAASVRVRTRGESRSIACDSVVSSIPLPGLARTLPAPAFDAAREAAKNIRYRSLCCVHLILDQERFSNSHWIYLLDDRLYANRLSEQKNLSPESAPPGKTVLCMDFTCDFDDYLWKSDDSFIINLAIADLKVMGIHPATIHDAFVLRAAHVYPVYTLGFERDVETIIDAASAVDNLYSIGRHGLLLNNDMHDSIEMGFMASQIFLEGRPAKDWYAVARRYVRERLEGAIKDPIRFDEKGAPLAG